jgi:hypothetical protein
MVVENFAGCGVAFSASGAASFPVPNYNYYELLPWIAVAGLGGLVGATELIGRYRDEPLKCLFTIPGVVYMVVNMCASLSAFALAGVFHWTIDLGAATGQTPGSQSSSAQWTMVLVAGLSAMALFRSSLFIRKIGDKDVGIGPGAVLATLLEVTDRYVDRRRGKIRVEDVNRIMGGLDFGKVVAELPPYCLSLLQNPSDEMQRDMKAAVDLTRTQAVDDDLKLRLLGLQLLNLVGVEALQKAVVSLGDRIKKSITARSQ